MDSLALLCTLHADGPATLGQLRRAGCQTLGDLQALPPETLAGVLQIPAPMARRLSREARNLAQRVGEDVLDAEEAPDGMVVSIVDAPSGSATRTQPLGQTDRDLIQSLVSKPTEARADQLDAPQSEAAVVSPPHINGNSLEGTPPGEPVTRGFRTHAKTDLPESPAKTPAAGMQPSVLPGIASVQNTPPPVFAQSGPQPGAAIVGAVDGLDRVVAAALAAAGVQELADLISQDANQLARATGLNFSRIRRLQFLARRQEASQELHQGVLPTPKSEPLLPKSASVPVPSEAVGEVAEPQQGLPAMDTPLVSDPTTLDLSTQPLTPPLGRGIPPLPPAPSQSYEEIPEVRPTFQFDSEGQLESEGTGAAQISGGSAQSGLEQVEDASPNDSGEEETLDLPNHPVFEFEPQSGGPMVAPNSSNSPRSDVRAAMDAEGEVLATNEAVVPSTPGEPVGRWLPREQRSAEDTPIDCEEPEPVLIPPPPARRFWEPKRFWEARKNRRKKALQKTVTETENLPDPGVLQDTKDGQVESALQSPNPLGQKSKSPTAEVEVTTPEVAQVKRSENPDPKSHSQSTKSDWKPNQESVLRWDFASPRTSAAGQGAQSARPSSQQPSGSSGAAQSEANAARGFDFNEPNPSTREDASGPFA